MPIATVGITGANGNVGKPSLKYLLTHATAGKIHLVVFHREGHQPSDLPNGTETRVLDLDWPLEKVQEAVRGLTVLVNSVDGRSLVNEPKLVEALAKTDGFVTLIPSIYGNAMKEVDYQHPKLGPWLQHMYGGTQRAKELGVGVTSVNCGVFDLFWFQIGFMGAAIQANEVTANEKQLAHPFPITYLDHLGYVIAELASSDPLSVKNTVHSAVTYWPTGQDIVDLYTRINGKPPTIKPYNDEVRKELLADPSGFGIMRSAGYADHWEANDWSYVPADVKYDGAPGLEELARRFV